MINSSLIFQLRDVVVETITKNLLSQLGTEFFLSEFVVFNFQRGYYYLSMIEAYLLLTRAHFRILKAPTRKKSFQYANFTNQNFFFLSGTLIARLVSVLMTDFTWCKTITNMYLYFIIFNHKYGHRCV